MKLGVAEVKEALELLLDHPEWPGLDPSSLQLVLHLLGADDVALSLEQVVDGLDEARLLGESLLLLISHPLDQLGLLPVSFEKPPDSPDGDAVNLGGLLVREVVHLNGVDD